MSGWSDVLEAPLADLSRAKTSMVLWCTFTKYTIPSWDFEQNRYFNTPWNVWWSNVCKRTWSTNNLNWTAGLWYDLLWRGGNFSICCRGVRISAQASPKIDQLWQIQCDAQLQTLAWNCNRYFQKLPRCSIWEYVCR